ncbi:hypothetical protein EGW08_019731 [Elysia chlorotica]|uniref:Neurotransmitter-gated ion-channel ligand-binding domain-containing protein n=1 Tax=Elysia chlorotica TaxID=188477 RepID=A0A3S0Z7J8_ELYCH|nr:hypothetical protein EGW08_019731 [Elysia chlorotica]
MAVCLALILTLVVPAADGSGSVFQPIGAERGARARLYSDLDSSPLLQNRLVPLSPACPVEVHVKLNVYKILEIIEPRQVINMALFFEFEWTDDAFAWDPARYDNVSQAYVPYDSGLGSLCMSALRIALPRAWHPEVVVANSAVGDFSLFPKPEYLRVSAQGLFHITGGAIVHTHCHIDLTFFPFDHQTCVLIIVVTGQDVKILPKAGSTQLIDGVRENVAIPAEWKVTSHNITVMNSKNVAQVQYTVRLDRASLYYLMCVLGPMAATSQLTLLVFWIPPDSGERISFLMSIYVSSTLYLGFVGDTLPRNNYSFINAPRMVLFMVFSVIECVLVLVATVISMHLHAAEQRRTGRTDLQTDCKGDNSTDKRVLRQGQVTLADRVEHKVPGGLSKISLEENPVSGDSRYQPNSEDCRHEPSAATERKGEGSRDKLVGTASKKRRIFENLSRFVTKRNKSKTPGRVCAQTFDRVMFVCFLACSLLFYFTIFKE